MTEFIRFSKIQGNFNMGTLWYLWVFFLASPISSSSQGYSRKLGSSDMWLLNKWHVNDSYSYSVPNFESSRISVPKISYFGGGLVTKSCPTLVTPWTRGSTRLLCAWDSPGKSTGVGCHFLLQGIFLTQELNPGLLHCRQILYHLSYEGSYFGQPLFLAPFSSELEKKKTTIGCCLSSLSISG